MARLDARNYSVEVIIESLLRESADVKLRMIAECIPAIAQISRSIVECLQAGRKVVVCGNGGSAADAQHLAAELVGKFRARRRPLAAIALTTDTSILTAVGNDWSFKEIFARQVEALGDEGDVLIAISTSGESENVLRAIDRARSMGMLAVGFVGGSTSRMDSRVDICLKIPSTETPRIQEGHEVAAHIVCDLVERAICDGDD